jgi:type IV secretory pathway VirB4 component
LNEGRIIADGTLKKILTDEKLLERSRLEPPLLTRLFQRIMEDTLSENDIPVTIDEAVDILNSQILNDSFPQGEHLTQ